MAEKNEACRRHRLYMVRFQLAGKGLQEHKLAHDEYLAMVGHSNTCRGKDSCPKFFDQVRKMTRDQLLEYLGIKTEVIEPGPRLQQIRRRTH